MCVGSDVVAQYVTAHRFEAVISSLPYFCNPTVAEIARAHRMHYFDLTEDVAVTDRVRAISEASDRAFIPQCGLAPGFISIVTNELIGAF